MGEEAQIQQELLCPSTTNGANDIDNYVEGTELESQSEIQKDKEQDEIVANDCNKLEDNKEVNGEQVLGKEFATLDDAQHFYNNYAFLHGFGTRVHVPHKKRMTNEVFRKQYVCNKQGFKALRSSDSHGISKKRRRDTRTGCEAMLRVTKTDDGKWIVDYFNDKHNHPLNFTPSKVVKHRSHAKFHRSKLCRDLITELNKSGLGPSQITKALNAIKDPNEVNITSKQCSDIISSTRKNNVGKECYELIMHFQEKASSDSSGYFNVGVDKTGTFKSVFWADGRSRESYLQFGDVVIFDVTYRTNKFQMPFAPFVGVNHHGQSILFGGALVDDESEDTFIWLFQQFLKCMFNRPPTAIITDQDGAICNAISKVFPNSRHRFCAWHIKKHVMEHLQPLKRLYSDFNDTYLNWVKSDTIELFENRWKDLCDKYEIDEESLFTDENEGVDSLCTQAKEERLSQKWLVKMYNLRKFWGKAYLKDTFFAGMTTSGRSESIHSYFDGFVNSNTMLNEFVIQYDKAVRARRVAEEDEDFKTLNSKAVLSSVHPIEVKAGECYTRNMFEVFKKQWTLATSNYTHETLSKNSEVVTYRVGLVNVDKDLWRTVKYYTVEGFKAICSCSKFETHGILCKHILYVMKKKKIASLPDEYILPRWTINSRYKMVSPNTKVDENNEDHQVSTLSLWLVQANFSKAIEAARDSYAEIGKLDTFLLEFLDEQTQRKKKESERISVEDTCLDTSQVDISSHISIRDPGTVVKPKGRPKKPKRIKSSIEIKINDQGKKRRTCSYCQGIGHYTTGCPKRKVKIIKFNLVCVLFNYARYLILNSFDLG